MQPSLWEFFRKHPIFGAGTLVGTIIAVGTLLLDGWHLFHLGLPPQALQGFGVLIIIASILGLLYKWWAVNLTQTRKPSATLQSSFPGTGDTPARGRELATLSVERLLVPLDVLMETNDASNITYKRKLRIVLRNDSGKDITILSANWRRRSSDDIDLKSQDRYLWQIEEQLGSWEDNKWKPEEKTEISAGPGFGLWTYIGLHDQATYHGVRRRLVQGRLGILTVVMRIDGEIIEQRISPGPIRT